MLLERKVTVDISHNIPTYLVDGDAINFGLNTTQENLNPTITNAPRISEIETIMFYTSEKDKMKKEHH